MADISGLDDMEAQMSALCSDLAASLPDIVLDAAGTVEREIAARAPVDTGRLVKSLDIESTHRARGATAIVQVDDSGKGADEHYAVFKEYGTSKMPASPFFRPGVEVAKPVVAAQMTNGILEVVKSHAS